jgi:aryl-alcohol dehydrogenase-like predicted oxidoreductase
VADTSLLTRPIPSTGEAIPAVGLGTWPVFDVGAAEKPRRPLREVMRRLIASGARVIDTSPMYGRAEEVTGDLVGVDQRGGGRHRSDAPVGYPVAQPRHRPDPDP